MMLQYVGYRTNYWEEQSASRHNELGYLTDLGIHREQERIIRTLGVFALRDLALTWLPCPPHQ